MNGKLVFWDWNGTLLDDVQYAIDVRNAVFPRYGLPKLSNRESYYDQFTFPIKLYYERAGVTEDNFHEVANAWMEEYLAGCHAVPLFPDAKEALERFSQAGYTQVIISASREDTLHDQLAHAGIEPYFQDVFGLSHIYATDKTHLAKQYLHTHAADPASCVFLGDTVHDAQVAASLNIPCVLVARGHMSRAQLEATGNPVCRSLLQAAALILGRNPGSA